MNRSTLLAEIEEYDSAEAMGRLDAMDGKRCYPCDWESGLSLGEQSDRVHEYLRGYEAQDREREREALHNGGLSPLGNALAEMLWP